ELHRAAVALAVEAVAADAVLPVERRPLLAVAAGRERQQRRDQQQQRPRLHGASSSCFSPRSTRRWVTIALTWWSVSPSVLGIWPNTPSRITFAIEVSSLPLFQLSSRRSAYWFPMYCT